MSIHLVSRDPRRFRAHCDVCGGEAGSRPVAKKEWAIAEARMAGWSVHPSAVLCPGCIPGKAAA